MGKKEEEEVIPEDLVRQELLEERKKRLVKRLSQKREAQKALQQRALADSRSKSIGCLDKLDPSLQKESTDNELAQGARKPRPKSVGLASGLSEMTKEEKEKRRQELLLKKKKNCSFEET